MSFKEKIEERKRRNAERKKEFAEENKGGTMKKVVAGVLTLVMVLSMTTAVLVGCDKTPDNPSSGNQIVTPIDPVGPGEIITPVEPNPGEIITPDDPVKPGPGGEIVDPVKPDPGGEIITPVDPAVTIADIENFDAILENAYGSIECYEIIDGDFFLFTEKDGEYSFYRANIGEDAGLETVGQLENLKEDLNEIQNVFSIKTEKNYLEYDGMKYNLNAIKGKNIFAERVGKNSENSVTTVDLEVNGTEATMKIYVVTGNETKVATIKTSSSVAMTVEDALDQLLLEDFSEMTTETITSGIDATRIDSAERPEEVIIAPAVLDYSALESKIIASGSKMVSGYSVKELLGYSVIDGDLYVITTLERKNRSDMNGVFKLDGEFSCEDQKNIDLISSSIGNEEFSRVVTLNAAQSDVTIDGVTYSKSGIEGDNIFAQQCGIENAELTFLSEDPGVGGQSYGGFASGYQRKMKILLIYEDNGEYIVSSRDVWVESSSNHTREEIYKNMITSGKYREENIETLKLGTLVGGSLAEEAQLEEELVK